jgi:glucose/mannose-6-phosphate isomerase
MRLEDPQVRRKQDPAGMLTLIERFPQMCTEAWDLGSAVQVPSVRPNVIVAMGMGGSGIGGDLLRAILFDEETAPVVSVKDYRAPGFAGRGTLAFACSYSGNTEETLAAYEEVRRRGATCVAVTSGGELLRLAKERNDAAVVVPPGLPPRAALPYLFIPMLAVLSRSGLLRSYAGELKESTEVLSRIIASEHPDGQAGAASRIAQRLAGRIPVIYSATPFLEPAAERWKDQFNENSKTFAVWNTFPELNHNETVGWGLDEALARSIHVIILRDAAEPPRLAQRVTITKELAFTRAGGLDEVRAQGQGKLARLLSTIVIGDFVSWYLATLRGVDPTPVTVIEELKRRLSGNTETR